MQTREREREREQLSQANILRISLQDRALCAFAPVTLLREFLNGTLSGKRADFVANGQGRMLILYFQHRKSPIDKRESRAISFYLKSACEIKF
jgi:hypothetical protein